MRANKNYSSMSLIMVQDSWGKLRRPCPLLFRSSNVTKLFLLTSIRFVPCEARRLTVAAGPLTFCNSLLIRWRKMILLNYPTEK